MPSPQPSGACVGLISDTHGFWDPAVAAIFTGVDHILHAGDVGSPRIVLELERIAPVTAVLGNVDAGLPYRETEVVTVCARTFLIHHIVEPSRLDDALVERLARARPDAVIFGHTHRPFAERIDGVLFVNPGSAGPQRFNLRRSVAILHCGPAGLRVESRLL
jgi:putative phosphoesterase